MRKEVKDNLLQALGAVMCVEPIDPRDRSELLVMEGRIKQVIREWVAYDQHDLAAALADTKEGENDG